MRSDFMTRGKRAPMWRIASMTLAALVPGVAAAQSAPGAQKIEKIEVTGSNIKRIDAETALPITIVTREEIERSGSVTVEELLNRIPSISSNLALNLSASSGATTGGQTSTSLRGLGGDRTLVLVNGRRIANFAAPGPSNTASVDLNAIPLAAIERVEVLKDGASAVYGSDAIAGVINFILRKDYQGAEVTAGGGSTHQGGGGNERASIFVGHGDLATQGFNVAGILAYEKQRPLYGAQRAYSSSSISYLPGVEATSGNSFPANIGIDLGGGIDPATGRYTTSSPGDVLSVVSRNPLAPNCAPSVLSPNFPSNRCRFDPAPLVASIPESERIGGSLYGRWAITPAIEAYVDLGYTRNKVTTQIQPVPISDQFGLPANNPLASQFPYNVNGLGIPGGFSTILLFPSSPFYPASYIQRLLGPGETPVVFVRYRALENGARIIRDTNDQYLANVGFKGASAGWDWSLGLQSANSKVHEETLGGYPLNSLILPLLNSGRVNFFGPNTPAISAALQATNYNGLAYQNEGGFASVSGNASRELAPMPGGALAASMGFDLRRETYKLKPSQALQSGDISGYGGNFLPVDQARNARAVYAELGAPFTRDLEATAALRFDDYQNVGSSTNPKVTLRWTASRALLLRAAAGTGFRAPSLFELHAPATQGVTAVTSDPVRCPVTNAAADCATQFTTFTGGSPGLKPEKARNLSAGIVFEPSKLASLSLDAFVVELRNQIITLSTSTILNNESMFPAEVVRAGGRPDGQIQYINSFARNLGEIRMTGLDIDGTLRTPDTRAGKGSLRLAGTYYTRYDVQNVDGTFSTAINVGGAPTGGFLPRWRHTLTLDWQARGWIASVTQNFQNSYFELYSNLAGAPLQRDVGAYETYDLQVAYRGFRNLTLAAGVRNLFDRAPPYVVGNGSFQTGYDIIYADPRGRLTYASVTYKF